MERPSDEALDEFRMLMNVFMLRQVPYHEIKTFAKEHGWVTSIQYVASRKIAEDRELVVIISPETEDVGIEVYSEFGIATSWQQTASFIGFSIRELYRG